MELTIENPNINDADRELYGFIIQHDKEYDYYLTKCHFILTFNDNQQSTYVKSNFFIIKTMISRQNFSENIIDDLKKGYNFNHIEDEYYNNI